MDKYIKMLGLLPIALVPMVFISDGEIHKYTEKICFKYLLYLIIFGLLYCMLLHMNKWFAISIATFLWVLSFFIKQKIYS